MVTTAREASSANAILWIKSQRLWLKVFVAGTGAAVESNRRRAPHETLKANHPAKPAELGLSHPS